MKNNLVDLNNHLFEQMERLNDDDLTEEELNREISITKSGVQLAKLINVAIKKVKKG